MSGHLSSLFADEDGASLVEYSILIGLLSAGVTLLVISVGYSIRDTWVYLVEELFAACFGGCPTDV